MTPPRPEEKLADAWISPELMGAIDAVAEAAQVSRSAVIRASLARMLLSLTAPSPDRSERSA